LNLDDIPDLLANDLDFLGPFDINESFDSSDFDLGLPGLEPIIHRDSGGYVCFNNPSAVKSPPETPVARRKRLNTVKRNYQEIQQQEKSNYHDDLGASDMEPEEIAT